VQLDCKLVDFELVNLGNWQGDFELDWDDLTEGLSLWSSESEVNGVNLVIICLNMRLDSQWDADFHRALALDFLLDWDTDDLDGDLSEGLLISKGEGASLLPWPVGVVEDFNLFNEGGAWAG